MYNNVIMQEKKNENRQHMVMQIRYISDKRCMVCFAWYICIKQSMIFCKSFQYDRCYLLLIQYSIAFKIFLLMCSIT